LGMASRFTQELVTCCDGVHADNATSNSKEKITGFIIESLFDFKY